MLGISWRREHGLKDPLLCEVMEHMGLNRIPLYDAASKTRQEYTRQVREMGERRDGPVNPDSAPVSDSSAMATTIKEWAIALGADLVGIAQLTPIMIDLDVDLSHSHIICIGVHEDYEKVLLGNRDVEDEAHKAYYHVARIATALAARIRGELGYPAIAHHNGGTNVQAIPALHAAGFGELGKHGSLINRDFGASFRPSFVTTMLPLVPDSPDIFGVQDACMHCNVCANNCPGDAIPTNFVVTEGVKRWLTDIAKCYPYSRLREEYCHLCVDACPYNAPGHKETYKTFMKMRRTEGFKTPKQS